MAARRTNTKKKPASVPRSRTRPADTRPPDHPGPAGPTAAAEEPARVDPAEAETIPSRDRRDADEVLAAATAEAEQLRATAEAQAQAILALARRGADEVLAAATTEAEQLRATAGAEAEAIRTEAEAIRSDARRVAVEMLAAAEAEAEQTREAAAVQARHAMTAATIEAERLVADGRARADEVLAAATADTRVRTAQAQQVVEAAERAAADVRAAADRVRVDAAEAAEAAEQVRADAVGYADRLRERAEAHAAEAERERAEREARQAEESRRLRAAAAGVDAARQALVDQRAEIDRMRETAERLMVDATSRAAQRARRREIAADARRRIREADTAAGRVPPLSFGERILLVVGVLAATVVSTLGLLSSYTALEVAAREWGWSWPWLLPVGIDVAIPAFTIIRLLLIRADMELRWVVWVPRALTTATIYLNWQAAHTLAGQVGHGALVLLWVIFSEVAAHVYASRIGAITGKRMETIRRSRWLLAPISTAVIRRRMILWEITSYAEALDRQRAHVLARAEMRANHGPFWRLKAPLRERVELRLGEREPAAPDANREPERFANPDGSRTGESVRVDLVRVDPGTRTANHGEPRTTTVRELERGSRTTDSANHEPRTANLTAGSRTESVHREPRTTDPAGSRTAEPASTAGARSANREPRTSAPTPAARRAADARTDDPASTAGARFANRRSQIDAVLDLIRELGPEAVTLSVVQQRTGMGKTTAHLRLKAARQEWAH